MKFAKLDRRIPVWRRKHTQTTHSHSLEYLMTRTLESNLFFTERGIRRTEHGSMETTKTLTLKVVLYNLNMIFQIQYQIRQIFSKPTTAQKRKSNSSSYHKFNRPDYPQQWRNNTMFWEYYRNKYLSNTEPDPSRIQSFLDNLQLPKLSKQAADILDTPLTVNSITSQLPKNKSSGPDRFYKHFWHILSALFLSLTSETLSSYKHFTTNPNPDNHRIIRRRESIW